MNNKDGVSALLKQAYENYNEDKDTSISGSGIAGRGAGGIRLMIERGWLKESEILDGSFFHNCIAYISRFNNNVISKLLLKEQSLKIIYNKRKYLS